MSLDLSNLQRRYFSMITDMHDDMDSMCTVEESISLALSIGIDKMCRYIIAKGNSHENTQCVCEMILRNLVSINLHDLAEEEAKRLASLPVVYSSDSE